MTSPQVIYNGTLMPADGMPLEVTNRAFRYGDGLFESIRLFEGRMPFWPQHVQRLQAGLDALGLNFELDADAIAADILRLASHHQYTNARIRFTLWRNSVGTYSPQGNDASYLLECAPLEQKSFILNEQGLNVGIYRDDKKYPGPLASFKTLSAQLYVLASRYAALKGWDDALILNTSNQVIEATSSNIFLVRGGSLHTPPTSQGCIDGTLRKVILQIAVQEGWQVSAGPVTEDTLKAADEVWLTNAINGIRWVGSLDGKMYTHKLAIKFMQVLNKAAQS